MSEPIIYEYERVCVNTGNSEMKAINAMAEQGYRLVAASSYYGGNALYFERPKQPR